jgi:hypothetical protein
VSGVRSEPVEVWLINGRPARFVWRERLYTVLSIIERPPAGPAPESGSESESESESESGAARARHPAGGHPGEQRHANRTGWRCWLVTASPGRNVPRNTYRLCHDLAADRWLLTRNGR